MEKNVRDRRTSIWHRAKDRRWASWEELNTWLAEQSRLAWGLQRTQHNSSRCLRCLTSGWSERHLCRGRRHECVCIRQKRCESGEKHPDAAFRGRNSRWRFMRRDICVYACFSNRVLDMIPMMTASGCVVGVFPVIQLELKKHLRVLLYCPAHL